MKTQRNCSIDILRLIFAIEIVALHTSPLIEFNETASYLLSQVFSRLAVPFFATVAGYFYFHNNDLKRQLSTLKKYFIIYTFWTAVMLLFDALSWRKSAVQFGKYAFKIYLFHGWHHLWYLHTIILVIIVLLIAGTLSDKLYNALYRLSFVPLIVGIMIANYGNLFFRIPFSDGVTRLLKSDYFCNLCIIVPFFMLGYKLNKPVYEKNKQKDFSRTVLCCVGLLVEVFLTTYYELHRNVILCFFTYPIIYHLMMWALKNPNNGYTVLAKYTTGMASLIYFGHFALMMFLVSRGVTETGVFIACVLLMACIGALVTRINNSIINRVI